MLSQTKMQLWYPRSTSEEKIKTYLASSHKKNEIVTNYENYCGIESDISDKEYDKEDYCTSEGDFSNFSSGIQSPQHSDCEENIRKHGKRNSFDRRNEQISDFIDLKYWKKENLCCGTIFRGIYGEIIIDPSLMKPCNRRLTKLQEKTV